MAALARPNHPVRLGAFFVSAALFASIVASAAGAAMYVYDDLRGGASSVTLAASDIRTPDGVQVVIPVEGRTEFEQVAGFAPFVPEQLPETTDGTAKFAVTPEDASGGRIGRVAFSARKDAEAGGISGPIVVIAQAQGRPGSGVDGQLKQLTNGGTRAVVATMVCGDLVLDVQLYFGPAAAEGEPAVTPYMTAVAQEFVDGVRRQCA